MGARPTVTVALLTHALQAMLFLQGLAAQRAGCTAGEGTRHQVMPVLRFLFGLLPLLSLLLFVSVLTLQGNKHRRGFFFFLFMQNLVKKQFLGYDIAHLKAEGSKLFVCV